MKKCTYMDSDSLRITPEQWQAACPSLKRVGSELKGPCPSCGGDDRFHVKLGEPYLWGCRKCEDAPAILAAAFPESRPPAQRPDLSLSRPTNTPTGESLRRTVRTGPPIGTGNRVHGLTAKR